MKRSVYLQHDSYEKSVALPLSTGTVEERCSPLHLSNKNKAGKFLSIQRDIKMIFCWETINFYVTTDIIQIDRWVFNNRDRKWDNLIVANSKSAIMMVTTKNSNIYSVYLNWGHRLFIEMKSLRTAFQFENRNRFSDGENQWWKSTHTHTHSKLIENDIQKQKHTKKNGSVMDESR